MWRSASNGWLYSGDCQLGDRAATADEVAAYLAAITPPITMSPLDFMGLFTDAEQLALATAAMTQAPIKLWYDKLLAADTVNLGDARVAAGVQAMVSAGLLTAARALAILGQS